MTMSGAVYMAIWDWCESELDLDVRFPAPQKEDTLDCALLEGELASQLLDVYKRQRYTMTFLGLHTFDHWGQSCTTGIFEKDGREFVFVPGDTVTLGWEQFAEGLNLSLIHISSGTVAG